MFGNFKNLFAALAVIIILVSCSNEDTKNPLAANSANESTEQYIVVVKEDVTLQSNSLSNIELISKSILNEHQISTDNIVAADNELAESLDDSASRFGALTAVKQYKTGGSDVQSQPE